MSDDKIFNLAFEKRGGLYDISKYDKSKYLSELLEILKSDLDAMKIPNIDLIINFINNEIFNASATKHSDKYLIGINFGTYHLLYSLFFRMLCSPNILVEYGDVTQEEGRKIFNAAQIKSNTLFAAMDTSDFLVPKNPIRASVAILMIRMSLQFLAQHEYAHIIMGHVDYLQNLCGKFQLSENEATSENPNLDPFLAQTCEFDADCNAVYPAIEMLYLHYKDYVSEIPNTDRLYFILSDFKKTLFLWLFSVYSLFRSFSNIKKDLQLLKSYTHPPAGIRQHLIFLMVTDVLETSTFIDRELANQILGELPMLHNQVISAVELAFVEISEQFYDSSQYDFGQKPESIEHLATLRQNWKNVKPLLTPFSKIPLAP